MKNTYKYGTNTYPTTLIQIYEQKAFTKNWDIEVDEYSLQKAYLSYKAD